MKYKHKTGAQKRKETAERMKKANVCRLVAQYLNLESQNKTNHSL